MIELSPTGTGQWRQSFTGDTMNTAWYLRQLFDETWNVEYFTALGTDPVSDSMQAFLTQSGILADNVIRLPGRQPGLYMIHLEEGERSFSYWRERSAATQLAADAELLA
jgi:2-dehydro-3-deoxygluconokinase